MNLQKFILVFFILILVVGIYFATNFKGGVNYGDHFSYAAIARSIVEGTGIYQNSYPPLGLANLGHYPKMDFCQSLGFPIAESFFFKILGTTDFAIAFSSAFFFVLMVFLTYVLTLRILKKPELALVSLPLMLVNFFILPYSISGLTEPCFTFLVLVSFLVYDRFQNEKWSPLVFGLLIGLSFLTRTSIIFYIPAIAYLLYQTNKKNTPFVKFTQLFVGIGLALLPVIIRSKIYSSEDDTYMTLFQEVLWGVDNTRFYHVLRSLDTTPLQESSIHFFMQNFGAEMHRFVLNFARIVYQLFFREVGLNFIFLSFALSFFLKPSDSRMKIFVRFTQLLFVFSLIGFAIAWPFPRYFYPIVPFVLVVALWSLTETLKKWKKLAFAVPLMITFICAPSLALLVKQTIHIQKNPPKFSYLKDFIQSSVPEGSLIVTNMPDLISWYGGNQRRALFFPNELTDVLAINEKYAKVDAILITDEVRNLFKANEEWKGLLENPQPKILEQFELKNVYRGEKSEAVLYLKKSN